MLFNRLQAVPYPFAHKAIVIIYPVSQTHLHLVSACSYFFFIKRQVSRDVYSPTSYFKTHISGTLYTIKANMNHFYWRHCCSNNEAIQPYHKGDMGASLRNFQSRGDFPKMAVLPKQVSQEHRELQTCSVGFY